MLLDIPYTLIYTFNGQGSAPFWLKKEEKEKFWTKTSAKGRVSYIVKPFKKEFRIGFDGDAAYYLDETGKRYETTVTKSGIRDYFELLADMKASKSLYKRHSSRDLQGNPMNFNVCNYCPLSETCDQFENDYERWTDEVISGRADK